MRITGLHLRHLNITDWSLEPDQVWCVLGENGAGKSQLAAALTGALSVPASALRDVPQPVAWVAFETQQAVFEADLLEHGDGFLGGAADGDSALSILLQVGSSEREARALGRRFGLASLLERPYRQLSSGEARRVMVARALLSRPGLLVLDEPFDGLDVAAVAAMHGMCRELCEAGQRLLLMVNRREDVAGFCTHLALLRDGRLALSGPREAVITSDVFAQLMHFDPARVPPLPRPPVLTHGDAAPGFDPLVRMRDCRVRYGDVSQFEAFDWTLRPGQHTLIAGENGCGKSTLLQLITGDHPQCYVNDLQVFGYQRGGGESIWDIKRHIGLVSPSLHRDYRVSSSVLDVVVSGLHDSIGVYRSVRPAERALATAWLGVLGLSEHAAAPLRALSYGQQRLVLIARALIKQPPLVILDEPTQGLDDDNRQLVLSFMAQLSGLSRTTLLFVSHRVDEQLSLFRQRLRFETSDEPAVRYRIRLEAAPVVA